MPREYTLLALDADEQLEEVGRRATDSRPTVATGWRSLDRLFHRGGFAPGELVILTGRTGTRKTTVVANLITNQLRAGYAVGFVGLDESASNYAGKVMSAMFDLSREQLEEGWDTPEIQGLRQEYRAAASRFVLSKGYRPSMSALTGWLEYSEDTLGEPLRVVYLDYMSLLGRGKYDGPEVQRVMRLVEDLQVWTIEHDVVVVALHQVGRLDEGTGGRYQGDTPMSVAGMKFGGEEVADYVLATYRPAKDPVGHMTLDEAFSYFPQNWKAEKVKESWKRSVDRVKKYRHSTFLQLLKNRPGVETLEEGIELVSPTQSMRMVEKDRALGSDMKYRPEGV